MERDRRALLQSFQEGGGSVAPACPTLATPWSIACQAPLSNGACQAPLSNGILQARILEWVAEKKCRFQIIKRRLHVNSLKLCTIFSSICKWYVHSTEKGGATDFISFYKELQAKTVLRTPLLRHHYKSEWKHASQVYL